MKRLTHKVIDLGYQYYDWTSINGDGENIKTVQGLKKKAIALPNNFLNLIPHMNLSQ